MNKKRFIEIHFKGKSVAEKLFAIADLDKLIQDTKGDVPTSTLTEYLKIVKDTK